MCVGMHMYTLRTHAHTKTYVCVCVCRQRPDRRACTPLSPPPARLPALSLLPSRCLPIRSLSHKHPSTIYTNNRMDETRTQLDWDLLERSTRKLGELELLMKQVRVYK